MKKNEKMNELHRQALALPRQPGVYIMKDAQNNIIYIGKAKALKNRVSQYFGSDAGQSEKVRRMVSKVERFEYIVTDNEFEALVLECSLIKQYSPKYNILLKDDKGYRYIKISPPPFPKISVALQKREDGSRYLGPYISGYVVKEAVDEANRIFQLPVCNRVLGAGRKERPCLNFYINRCFAPCSGRVSEEEYNERVDQAIEFLTRGSAEVLSSLTRQMNEVAENLEFEKAARLRDRINAIKKLGEKQKVVRSKVKNQDVIALARSGKGIFFEIFRFKKGALYDREDFFVDGDQSLPAVRAEFIRRYYSMRDNVPPRIAIDGEIEDKQITERWLSEKAGRKVRIVNPQKGEQARLVQMCRSNAAERAAQHDGIAGRDAAALDELARLLGLKKPPQVIESYDVSNTSGSDTVAGMVVFENARPLKSAYRRFKIKTVVGQDDYAAMQEAVARRLDEYQARKGEDSGFGRLPDLILVDGGRGHVSAVRSVLKAKGHDIPVFGMVKDSRHKTRAISSEGGEIAISGRRSAFSLVSSIQEEVHRFTVEYHRRRRAKGSIGSSLTKIEGVGEKRAAALLKHFGSIKAVRAASVDELAAVRGMTRPAAEAVRRYFETDE